MNTLPTKLFDRQLKQDVSAAIRFDLTADAVLGIEAVWGPWRQVAIARLSAANFPEEQMPQHWHWNWAQKVPKFTLAGYRGIGVESGGEMQGLMLIATANYTSRVGPDMGRPLVYIDFVESAPWNVTPLAEAPRFSGVGQRLVWAAVRVSFEEGFHGRVGLHSLPQAEVFYEQRCGMVRVGVDPDYESLTYFELTRERAAEILAGGQGV
jgi:hypothetical protein